MPLQGGLGQVLDIFNQLLDYVIDTFYPEVLFSCYCTKTFRFSPAIK